MKSFTKKFMRENCGCYDQSQLEATSFMKVDGDIISLESIINSEIPVKDKFWFVCKKLANKEQNKKLAIALAEIVLPIYEQKYPNGKAPREAIEAAKQYLSGHISLNDLLIKRKAAAYAAAAADAAAATAAAYAAAAATAAAYAADDAYAAADAAADAAAAADDDAYKKQIFTLLVNLCEEISKDQLDVQK